MDEYRPSFRCSVGGHRSLEIVSGEGLNADTYSQIYTTASSRPRTPESPHFPVREASLAAKPWEFNDPEMKRRKRIARYKVYTMEGRVKASIRKGLHWIKNKCSEIILGY